jgi:hypothetical protein
MYSCNWNLLKKVTVVFVLVILGLLYSQPASAQLTRDQAIAILMEQVIEPTPNKKYIWAFGPQNMLVPGDVVRPLVINAQPNPGQPFTVVTQTWFFFIDDDILSKYSHETRYVYLDANHLNPTVGDGITLVVQGWWPVINGQPYYDFSTFVGHSDKVYGVIPENPQTETMEKK